MMNGRSIENAITGVSILIFLGAVCFILVQLLGCASRQPGDLPAYCYREELYTAKLLRCVDAASTLAESQACRQRVDYDCGIRQTTRAK